MENPCKRCGHMWDMDEVLEDARGTISAEKTRIVYCPACHVNGGQQTQGIAVLTGFFRNIPPEFDVLVLSIDEEH